jgi:3-deoxy-D-manno-octulosonic-acid transferase
MRHIYSLLLYLLTPFALVYFLLRGLGDRRWWLRWRERFGWFNSHSATGGIWIHAVSVGEVNAATPLVRAIQQRWPEVPLTMTCFTPTGSERVAAIHGNAVRHTYAPLDLPGAVERAFHSIKPRLLLVMETEIWPNLFRSAERNDVPILIANARLTERSARSWGRFQGLVSEALGRVSMIAAQTESDAARFLELGASADRTVTCGNLKFDITLPAQIRERGEQLRERWGAQRPVLVAGSTHEDDEAALLSAFQKLLEEHSDALLVIAPRYPERFARVAQKAVEDGFITQRVGESGDLKPNLQCLVVDRMGELLAFYAAGDLAFVGGTLAPVGGHNPLEASALGLPVMLGPHTGHISDLVSSLLDAGAAIEVADSEALYAAWSELLSEPARRQRMGQAALGLVEKQRGAVARTLQAIESLLIE